MAVLRHVYLRLKPEHRDGSAFEAVLRAALRLDEQAQVEDVQLLIPADEPARAAWDLCLQLRFASLEDAQAHGSEPGYRRFVDEFLAPRVLIVKAWNLEAAADPPEPAMDSKESSR